MKKKNQLYFRLNSSILNKIIPSIKLAIIEKEKNEGGGKDPILVILSLLNYSTVSICLYQTPSLLSNISKRRLRNIFFSVLLFLGSKSQLLLKIIEIWPMRLLIYDYFACKSYNENKF